MLKDTDFDGEYFPYEESDKIELKEGINIEIFDKYRETICGFLNTHGGNLIFGVKDDLKIVGIGLNRKGVDEFICRIDQIISGGLILKDEENCLEKLTPDSIVVRKLVNNKGKKFLILEIKNMNGVKCQLRDGLVCHRLNATNYNEKVEKIYKKSEVDAMLRQAAQKHNSLTKDNIQKFQKDYGELNVKVDNLNKKFNELSDTVNDYENYMIKDLIRKVNTYSFTDTIWEYMRGYFICQ